jgi:hypothetical protein
MSGVQRFSYEIIKLLDSCNLIISDKIQECYDISEVSHHNFNWHKLHKNYFRDNFLG